MRRESTGVRFGHLWLAVLLCLPPGARVGMALLGRHDAKATDRGKARESASEAQSEPVSKALEPADGRYRLVPGSVLPFNDPSGGRSALWMSLREKATIPVDTAAVFEKSLVGRVTGTDKLFPITRVQSLLDPAFRIRFRQPEREAEGMLWGTGKSFRGLPILEIRHLSQTTEFEGGEAIFTDGKDGLYPPDLLIGYVTTGGECGNYFPANQFVVLGAVEARQLTSLNLQLDLHGQRLAELLRAEREGGRKR